MDKRGIYIDGDIFLLDSKCVRSQCLDCAKKIGHVDCSEETLRRLIDTKNVAAIKDMIVYDEPVKEPYGILNIQINGKKQIILTGNWKCRHEETDEIEIFTAWRKIEGD